MAAGVPGVVETGRACVAFSVYRKHAAIRPFPSPSLLAACLSNVD